MRNYVKEILNREIKTRYGRDVEVKDTDRLEEDLMLDSLDRIEIWLAMEGEFKLDIQESEVATLKTVDDCINLVEKHINKGKT